MQSTSDQCGGGSNGSEDEPEIVSDNAKHTKGTRSKSNIKKKHEIKDNPNKKVTKKSNAKSKSKKVEPVMKKLKLTIVKLNLPKPRQEKLKQGLQLEKPRQEQTR